MKPFKENQICYVLYVNLTSNYISFKIEKGKFLGLLKDDKFRKSLEKDFHLEKKDTYVIEHFDDEVNYLQLEDIYHTKLEAMRGLANILNKKLPLVKQFDSFLHFLNDDIKEIIFNTLEKAKKRYGIGKVVIIDDQKFYRFPENEGRDVDYLMRYERKFVEYLTDFGDERISKYIK